MKVKYLSVPIALGNSVKVNILFFRSERPLLHFNFQRKDVAPIKMLMKFLFNIVGCVERFSHSITLIFTLKVQA
jgi:hypothetical protein